MIAANNSPRKRKSHPGQVYPISLRRAAKATGYTPGHIARVLRGERVSAPTLRAYNALVAQESEK